MAKWLEQIEKWMSKGKQGESRVRTFRFLLLLGLTGVGIMILNSFISVETMDSNETDRASPKEVNQEQEVFFQSDQETSVFAQYEREYETRIKEILSQIVGVDGLNVMVSIESTEEKVIYRNTQETQQITNEQDSQGSTRQITEISKSGDITLIEVSGEQQPIIIKTIKPEIRGIIVVANGAENPTVKMLIVDSIRKGLDVPSNRISVVPRKQP